MKVNRIVDLVGLVNGRGLKITKAYEDIEGFHKVEISMYNKVACKYFDFIVLGETGSFDDFMDEVRALGFDFEFIYDNECKYNFIPMERVEAANIRSVGYCPATRIVRIDFMNNISIVYESVPEEVYKTLRESNSSGLALHKYFYGEYTYKRIK